MDRRGARIRRIAALAGAVTLLVAVAAPARADFESAKKHFLEKVKDGGWKGRRGAYGALEDHDGGPSAALILQYVGSETHPVVHDAAATTLGKLRSDAARAATIAAFTKGKGVERLVAGVALHRMRGNDVDAAFVGALATAPPQVAALAASALAQAARSGAGPALIAALGHQSSVVRGAAAKALGVLGDKAAIAPLVSRLSTERHRARADVLGALEAITKHKFGDAPRKWAAIVSGGDPATIDEKPVLPPTFFGVPVTGERVVFVLDRSLNMSDPHPWAEEGQRERLQQLCDPPDGDRIPWRQIKTKMHLAQAQLRHAVAGLGAGKQFEVLYFADDVRGVFEKKLTPVATVTRKVLDEALAKIETDDGINLWSALLDALDIAGAAEDRAVKSGPEQVFLVTNNVPTRGEVSEADPISGGIGFRARTRSVPITVVGIGDHAFTFAASLAKTTGGVYVNLTK